MNRKHALTISFAVGAAAIAGGFAATKTIDLGHPAAPTPTQSPSTLVARRTKALDRAEAALRQALKQRPPKLPPLPATVPDARPTPASAGSPVTASAPVRQPARRVVYVRPAPRVVTVHRAGAENESEHESEHESEGGGGGFDD